MADQGDKRIGGELETANAGVSVAADQAEKVNGGEPEAVYAEVARVSAADQGDKRNAGVSVADQANGGEPETVNAGFWVDERNGETVNAGGVVDKKETGEDAGSTTSPQLRRMLNRQNRYGQTALHIAAQKGSVWFIERLLTAGAAVDVPNAYGFRAVDVAKKCKQPESADILRKWESSRQQAPTSKKSSRKARRKKHKAAESSSSSIQAPAQQVD